MKLVRYYYFINIYIFYAKQMFGKVKFMFFNLSITRLFILFLYYVKKKKFISFFLHLDRFFHILLVSVHSFQTCFCLYFFIFIFFYIFLAILFFSFSLLLYHPQNDTNFVHILLSFFSSFVIIRSYNRKEKP